MAFHLYRGKISDIATLAAGGLNFIFFLNYLSANNIWVKGLRNFWEMPFIR